MPLLCVRVSVCERHWHSERGWQSPGLGDEACVAAAIDLLVSVVQSAAGAPWLTCLETNDGECTDFMLWGILTLSDCFCFWIEAHSRLSSCRRCVCACTHAWVCVCRICACTNVSARFSYCCVMYKWVWVAFKELLRCMNILKCSNIQKTPEREGKSWVTPWNTKVVPY